MSAAHDREPEDLMAKLKASLREAGCPEPESTISRTDLPPSDATLAAFEEFVECLGGTPWWTQMVLRYLDGLDEPSAHHRPRLNALLLAAKSGQLA